MKFQLLEPGQLDQLHEASLTILERTGLQVDHSDSLERLHDAGCRVDSQVAR